MSLLAVFILLLQNPAFPHQAELHGYSSQVARKLSPDTAVTVVAGSKVEAGMSGDGTIYLSAGLFARLQNEAQLAGVIAHQLAHFRAGTDCIRFVHPGGVDEEKTDDRRNESAADQTAILLLTKAGYQPVAMLDFFSAYRHEDAGLPHAFSARDLLMEKLELEATDHPLKNAIVNTPEFDRVRALIQ